MRRIVLAFGGTVVAVVLLFGYRTSHGATVAHSAAAATTPATTGGSAPSASASPSGGSSSGTSGSSAKTYAGSVAQTRWGPVQVQITVQGGKITAATTLQIPDGNGRDEEINSYAVPQLNQEVVSAQSAQIDTVSGATVTSDGYLESLQAAITAAGL